MRTGPRPSLARECGCGGVPRGPPSPYSLRVPRLRHRLRANRGKEEELGARSGRDSRSCDRSPAYLPGDQAPQEPEASL